MKAIHSKPKFDIRYLHEDKSIEIKPSMWSETKYLKLEKLCPMHQTSFNKGFTSNKSMQRKEFCESIQICFGLGGLPKLKKPEVEVPQLLGYPRDFQ